jgi:hypothetical protein
MTNPAQNNPYEEEFDDSSEDSIGGSDEYDIE